MRPIRTSAKAIIVRDEHLLVIHLWDEERGDRYILPGGGQHHSETLPEALFRECFEEIGVAVEVHELLFIREYIGQRGAFAEFDPEVHQVEFMFRCTVLDGAEPAPGHEPDTRQVGIAWLLLARLRDHRLFPAALSRHIDQFSGRDGAPVYLDESL